MTCEISLRAHAQTKPTGRRLLVQIHSQRINHDFSLGSRDTCCRPALVRNRASSRQEILYTRARKPCWIKSNGIKVWSNRCYLSLSPETFFHGAWIPGSPWPSESVRARSRLPACPGSGPRRLERSEKWWALQTDKRGKKWKRSRRHGRRRRMKKKKTNNKPRVC